ncbi:AsmA family protein [Lentibacter algarum]|uniref:AsmA family protein n=1 Tax=Lentibacter algarum TaxID=576131 RepID=UPI001C09F691|nr:AsmA family protein [Lentibacter algarum]MBU2983563.1 AsmA family protein [Lentibacter algarum]
MGLIRKLLLAIVVFVLLVVAGLFMLPKERIAKVASTELSKALGRDVVLSGDLGISLWPVLGVKTGPVLVAAPEWAGDAPLLKAEALNIGVSAAAALRGDIEVRRLVLVAPEVSLVKAKDGRESWAFGDDSGEGGSSTARKVSLERAEVSGGSLVYRDLGTGTVEQLSAVDAVVSLPDLNGPLTVSGSGRRGNGALAIEAVIADAGAFLSGRLVGVKASVTTQGGSASFNGQATQALDAKGKLQVNAKSTAQFLAALGLDASAPPQGLGQAIGLSADMIYSGGSVVNLRSMALDLDNNRVEGEVDVRFDRGSVPMVTANLRAGALDFAALSSEGGSGEASSGWSTTPIDAGGLAAVNAKVRLAAASVDLGMMTLGATDMSVTLEQSRGVFKLNKATGYGGTIVGEFVINNRSGLSVGGDLSVLQADVKPLLMDLAGVERLSGKGDGQIKFLGVGQNLNAIMNSLKGSGGLAMGQGTIAGFDLDKLMSSGSANGTTVFNQMGASFTIEGGVLRNDNLQMLLENYKTTGSGRVGLGARDIDYTFVPTALRARGGKGLAIPVRVRGPWADPKILPDLSAAIDLNLAEEKAKVEQKAKDAVKAKIEQELGVTLEEGESVEDAVKEKVEDKVKKELLKIFE